MNKIEISVVIGTYNQKDKLKIVLESLIAQTLSPTRYEIIIVDSMSDDGTSDTVNDIISNHPLPVTRYFIQENMGRPGARNRGIKEAQGEIILLTDADMLADPNLLQQHLKAHEEYSGCAFEGLTYNIKPETQDPKSETKTNIQIQISKDAIEPYIKEKLKPLQKIRWSYFLTGNLSIPKEIIETAGMFDMDFAGYGWEDIELGYRLNKSGIPLRYLPSAINYHMHPVSSEEMFKRKLHMGRSAAIFYKKHPNLEIKLFLGINPIAHGIFKIIKTFPRLQKRIESRSSKSDFNKYLWEEYQYRLGLEEELL